MNSKNRKNSEETLNKIKHGGKIYTPDYLVNVILNQGHYVPGNINKKHVIDNSCGNGQFIVKIVEMYCDDFLKNSNNLTKLKEELETYIHAIEIDSDELNVCIQRCNKLIKKYGLTNIAWDFINGDTLSISKFNNMMDFVIGNPPYVRVHNLNENYNTVKSYLFGSGGMTDLYIVFYEIGLKMLNDTGILTYITPSSFFTSLAGNNLRNYLIDNCLLESVCDLKHFQAFNATTYTAIVCLNKNLKSDDMLYYEFDVEELRPKHIDILTPQSYNINGMFYFSQKEQLNLLKKILNTFKRSNIEVKNGYATLCDAVFIRDFPFDSKYIIPVIKASRAKWTKIFYPYDELGNLISEENLKQEKNLYDYLGSHKEELNRRSNEKSSKDNWYAFGRSQGIKDTYKNKIAISTLIKNENDLKIVDVPAGSGVYGGLYILSNGVSNEKIISVLKSKEFGTFISLLGKYKSGGCYTFSSKDVKCYLDYKFGVGGLFDYDD